ncbi:TlpA disulfide reductase family protein [Pedobacter sp. MC2016-24]|uniref:TlpA family protein disulfide reductase n=1 Tax=Pedobacter sp. MC2016-24 TaxID=2780090 RepID=UPI00187F7FA6|nr:TlpA disulfide reductase family protein [Pedobacter sp. MC2016-24]MBE9600295.1 TlpA family protein disulfide reductase [Pedobacter sp. MC2016-24]
MKPKTLIFILIFIQLITGSILFAQADPVVLKKGDIVNQNMVLGKMINYSSKTAKFSDFKGKLLILDFWATWCSPCVDELQRLNAFQKKFGNKIAVVGVDGTYRDETAEKAAKYFAYKKFIFPSVVEDNILGRMFPFQTLSTKVWISENGKILAITDGDQVTEQNISQYFRTKTLNLKEKVEKDVLEDTSVSKRDENSVGDIAYQSIIIKQYDMGGGTEADYYSFRPGMMKLYKSKCVLFSHYLDILSMHRQYFPYMNPNYMFIETKDSIYRPLHYFEEVKNGIQPSYEWNDNGNNYFYDVKFSSPGMLDSLFYRKQMLEDFNKAFKFKARIIKKKIPSWIIVKSGNGPVVSNAQQVNIPSKLVYDNEVDKEYLEGIQNMTIDKFILAIGVGIDVFLVAPPIYNETGLGEDKINLDKMHLKCMKDKAINKPLNIIEWQSAFRRNGLDIKVEDREIEVIVLSNIADKDTPSK